MAIKKYGNAKKPEKITKLMNSTHRSFSYLKVKNITQSILCKLLTLFSSLQDSQATMDIWFIGNAVKEIFEAYDQYYFAITLLKPGSSTCYQTAKIKQFYGLYKGKSKPSKVFINELQERLNTSLIHCEPALPSEFQKRFIEEKRHFLIKSSALGRRFEASLATESSKQNHALESNKVIVNSKANADFTSASGNKSPLSTPDINDDEKIVSPLLQSKSNVTGPCLEKPANALGERSGQVSLSTKISPKQNDKKQHPFAVKTKSSLKRKREGKLQSDQNASLPQAPGEKIPAKKTKLGEPVRY
ncbi:uncharacterized protein LOC135682779 [Rhopilema esculentum]|uniref:uncharacterized protein LOC135682779 n=1 Tax=Rhopilema esculentum TaxID=499914 RepID=UPI0031E210D6